MILKEEKRDLFSVDKEYALAHCIALDCGMGAGIAVQFANKYPQMKTYLKNVVLKNNLTYPCVVLYEENNRTIYNMITKEKSWYKPTYLTFEGALDDLVFMCKTAKIKKIAIPYIGCGLDRLDWNKVRNMIEEKFNFLDIEILVCYI